MRIPQPYGQRSSVGISEAKIKYFLAYEGRRTEYRYFRGIHINRNEVGIDSLVEIIPIEHDSKTSSNPLNLYNEAKESLDNCDNYFPEAGDQFCLIVDRDRKSFSEIQYEELLKYEKNGNINLIVSNPCFEFWLLLHFKKCSDIAPELIFENKKEGNRTFVENLLKNCLGGSYSKSRLKFEQFKNHINEAIANSRTYATEPGELKNKIGTNVGLLIERMQQHQ